MVTYPQKEKYDINDLIEVIRLLRQPDGCPWDKEQTHASVRMNFIEEVYEVIEAIDKQDTALMREELGDVLMQVVFHTQMEREQGNFTFEDVCDEVCRKLIIRHPHVFSNVQDSDTGEVLNEVAQEGSNVIGFARIYFEDCFVINNVTVIQGKENAFVSMPSYKTKEVDENNKPVYRDYSDSLIIPIL